MSIIKIYDIIMTEGKRVYIKKGTNKNKGFTLIELLAVIVILQ